MDMPSAHTFSLSLWSWVEVMLKYRVYLEPLCRMAHAPRQAIREMAGFMIGTRRTCKAFLAASVMEQHFYALSPPANVNVLSDASHHRLGHHAILISAPSTVSSAEISTLKTVELSSGPATQVMYVGAQYGQTAVKHAMTDTIKTVHRVTEIASPRPILASMSSFPRFIDARSGTVARPPGEASALGREFLGDAASSIVRVEPSLALFVTEEASTSEGSNVIRICYHENCSISMNVMMCNVRQIYYQAMGFEQVEVPRGRVIQHFTDPAATQGTASRSADQGRTLEIHEHSENAPVDELVIQVIAPSSGGFQLHVISRQPADPLIYYDISGYWPVAGPAGRIRPC